MTGDDDILNVKMSHGIFEYGMGIEVCGRNEVADVAVNEDLTGLKAHDIVDRHTAVGASEVEVARLLRTSDPLCTY